MKYFILNGVRRAVASLQAGRRTIPAIVYREGYPPKLRRRLRLDCLWSGKTRVTQDLRFLRISPPILEPIEVEWLDARRQPKTIPLWRVVLS